MRILIAAPAPRLREGGVANVVHNMAEALRERGHEVTCIFTFYRLQGQNFFQNIGDLKSLRRKYDVMVALTEALTLRFAQGRVPLDASSVVIGALQVEVDALRMALGEGSPWHNFRRELREYHLHHEDAGLFRRFLKFLSSTPALFLPSSAYNSLKRSLFSNHLYVNFRGKLLPFHEPTHVDRTERWKP